MCLKRDNVFRKLQILKIKNKKKKILKKEEILNSLFCYNSVFHYRRGILGKRFWMDLSQLKKS